MVTAPRSTAAPRPIVLKLGGRALDAPGAAAELAGALAGRAADTVIVHGGGAEVSAWCARLGIAPRFADGLRVTDPDTLEVAVAVLAGLANRRLVAALRAGGVDAVGLAALDGVATVEPHADAARLGAVGRVTGVAPERLRALLEHGQTPVLASIGACGTELLNLNADDLAAALAAALGAEALVLLSDTPGLVLDGAVVPELEPASLDAALADPRVTGGMRPKLRAAREAVLGGAARAHIAAWQGPGSLDAILAGDARCTTVTVGARPAPAEVA
jgi:acetylglutamate kinase